MKTKKKKTWLDHLKQCKHCQNPNNQFAPCHPEGQVLYARYKKEQQKKLTDEFKEKGNVKMELSLVDWENFRNCNSLQLFMKGFVQWDKPNADGKVLMLMPAEWIKSVPHGFELESISGDLVSYNPHAKSPQEEGYVDLDTRSGLLAFGIRVKL